jgi:hypothetical protein
MSFEIDIKKLIHADTILGEIIKEGERYYTDEWCNALKYTKSLLEWQINSVQHGVNNIPVNTVSNQSINVNTDHDDYHHGDNVHF